MAAAELVPFGPNILTEIAYIEPIDRLDEQSSRIQDHDAVWISLHDSAVRNGSKMLVDLDAAFAAVFPEGNAESSSSDDNLDKLAENALDYINSLCECNESKSREQTEAEQDIIPMVKHNVLIARVSNYSRMKRTLGEIKKLHAHALPDGGVYLCHPSVIVDYGLLAQYKGLKGEGPRTGHQKCAWFLFMERRDQLDLLRTAYQHAKSFQGLFAIVRFVPDPVVALRPQGMIKEGIKRMAVGQSGETAKRRKPSSDDPATTTSSSGPNDSTPLSTMSHNIDGSSVYVLPTSGKGLKCGLYALQHSIYAQPNIHKYADDFIVEELGMVAASGTVQQKIKTPGTEDAGPRLNHFAEDELALVLRIWASTRYLKYQLGVFVEGVGYRVIFHEEGYEIIWIHHDNSNHWSGISFSDVEESLPLLVDDRASLQIDDTPSPDNYKSSSSDSGVSASSHPRLNHREMDDERLREKMKALGEVLIRMREEFETQLREEDVIIQALSRELTKKNTNA